MHTNISQWKNSNQLIVKCIVCSFKSAANKSYNIINNRRTHNWAFQNNAPITSKHTHWKLKRLFEWQMNSERILSILVYRTVANRSIIDFPNPHKREKDNYNPDESSTSRDVFPPSRTFYICNTDGKYKTILGWPADMLHRRFRPPPSLLPTLSITISFHLWLLSGCSSTPLIHICICRFYCSFFSGQRIKTLSSLIALLYIGVEKGWATFHEIF